MKPVHYDLVANEAELRRAADEGYAASLARAPDADGRRFVEVQHRLRDLGILPRLETMRSINDAAEHDIVVGAMAVKVAVALWNIAELRKEPVEDVVEFFVDILAGSLSEIEDASENPDVDGSLGSFTRTREIMTEGGNA